MTENKPLLQLLVFYHLAHAVVEIQNQHEPVKSVGPKKVWLARPYVRVQSQAKDQGWIKVIVRSLKV